MSKNTKEFFSGAELVPIVTRFVWYGAGVVLISCLLLVGIEGLASYILIARNAIETESLSARRFTKYDATLGWVNEPNIFLPDLYGPGIYLRTNAQQFRANHDTPDLVAQGKIRVVCSGDSFMEGITDDFYRMHDDAFLGYGKPRLEVENAVWEFRLLTC